MELVWRIKACEVCVVVVWMMCNVGSAGAWGWLMSGNWSSTNFTLPCDATYCVNLPYANASMQFHLHRCVGVSFWEEQFSYDGTRFFMSTSKGIDFCLDVVGDGTKVGLRACDEESPSQRWNFNGTKLQNGLGLFLMVSEPLVPYASDASLIVGEYNSVAPSDWTFMDSSSLGNSSIPVLPASRSANLVQNNQFLENWGGIQAEGSPGDMTLLCGWTILGFSRQKTFLVRNTVTNWSVGWNVVLGAISQMVPTYPGEPHTLKFNVKVNGTCVAGELQPAQNKLLVSLTPSSSELNFINVDSNDGLWKAEEIKFLAFDSTVNLTFASLDGHPSCSVVIGNIEVGLEDDYLKSVAAGKLRKRLVYLYTLVALFGTVALAVSIAFVVGSLRSRKLVHALTQRFSGPLGISMAVGSQKRTQRLRYAYLHAITEGFSAKNSIGVGGFANVYKGTTTDGVVVAIKKAYKLQSEKEFKQEIDMLDRVHHRRLVRFLGYCDENGAEQILVFEYMSNGSLHQQLHDHERPPLSFEIRFKIAQDVAQGLEYLHHGANPPIIHRDVKSANVLLDEKLSAKVADFGIFKLADSNTSRNQSVETNVKGSYGYMDPRQMDSGTISTKSDVYSFGVVLLELITGRRAIDQESLLSHWAEGYYNRDEETLSEMLDPRLNKSFDISKLQLLVHTAQQCLLPSRDDRPSMSDVVRWLGGEPRSNWDSNSSTPLLSTGVSTSGSTFVRSRSNRGKPGLAIRGPDRSTRDPSETEIEDTSSLIHSVESKTSELGMGGRWIEPVR
ncbi:hypothetical protein M758_8G023000 [Ceratodon purpureus]|nr:hypothetical protein M758_8G023000 [Ceratodon purpureus]